MSSSSTSSSSMGLDSSFPDFDVVELATGISSRGLEQCEQSGKVIKDIHMDILAQPPIHFRRPFFPL